MKLDELLDRITFKQKKRVQKRRGDYRQLVRKIAEGQEPDEIDISEVLDQTGISVDQLRQDVDLMVQRLDWRRQYELREKLDAEKASLQEQIAAADEILDNAENEHEAKVAPMMARIEAIRQEDMHCSTAERRLTDTCMDVDLVNEIRDLNKRMKSEDSRRSELEAEIDTLRRGAESDLELIPSKSWVAEQEELKERAKRRKARAGELEPQLKEVRKTLAKLREREEALRERLLVP